MATIRIEGLNEAIAAIKNAPLQVGDAFARGLLNAGEFLLEESQAVVPVLTGKLRDSGYVKQHGRGLEASVDVGYSEEYALAAHEDLESKKQPGEQAKFLEGPAREHADKLVDLVAEETRLW